MKKPPEQLTPELTSALMALGWTGGPIRDFIKGLFRDAALDLALDVTDPVKLGESIHSLIPELFPATVADLASCISDRARRAIQPLLK
jgi:hypothetical protein